MRDPDTMAAVLVFLVAAFAMLSLALLKAWNDWLRLRRLALGEGRGRRPGRAAARIELADLKDRVRRLEAIADGMER